MKKIIRGFFFMKDRVYVFSFTVVYRKLTVLMSYIQIQYFMENLPDDLKLMYSTTEFKENLRHLLYSK